MRLSTYLGATLAGLMLLSACGAERADPADPIQLVLPSPLSAGGDHCDRAVARVDAMRHAVLGTPAWRTMEASAAWANLAQASGDAVPAALSSLRRAPVYLAMSQDETWRMLRQAYAVAQSEHCLEPNGPINPSPNPAPNPTPVPPTNPTTGNTEPGGDTGTGTGHGEPKNPSPDPAPNPTPVPPTNPTTGNTEPGGDTGTASGQLLGPSSSAGRFDVNWGL